MPEVKLNQRDEKNESTKVRLSDEEGKKIIDATY